MSWEEKLVFFAFRIHRLRKHFNLGVQLKGLWFWVFQWLLPEAVSDSSQYQLVLIVPRSTSVCSCSLLAAALARQELLYCDFLHLPAQHPICVGQKPQVGKETTIWEKTFTGPNVATLYGNTGRCLSMDWKAALLSGFVARNGHMLACVIQMKVCISTNHSKV